MPSPSEAKLTAELKSEISKTFHSEERDKLSVKFIRAKVEGRLRLADGFFTRGEWKEKSKGLIKGFAVS
jgi:hypothetical protein